MSGSVSVYTVKRQSGGSRHEEETRGVSPIHSVVLVAGKGYALAGDGQSVARDGFGNGPRRSHTEAKLARSTRTDAREASGRPGGARSLAWATTPARAACPGRRDASLGIPFPGTESMCGTHA